MEIKIEAPLKSDNHKDSYSCLSFSIPKSLSDKSDDFFPYERDEKTLARKWAIPGVKGLEHRIGGLEKADQTGNVSNTT